MSPLSDDTEFSESLAEAGLSLAVPAPPPRRAEDLLTPTAAAEIAGRSVRTIRRAYRSGALLAHRDGNGRRISIRYADLREWMLASTAAAPTPTPAELELPVGRPTAKRRKAEPSDNLALLRAARRLHEKRRRGRAAAAARPAAARSASWPA